MSSKSYNLKKELNQWLSKAERVVVVGIGNPLRMDDFIGIKIIQDLQGKVSDKNLLIECETVPENYIQQIIDFNPTHILLIDAAILGLKHGEAKLLKPEYLIDAHPLSTHRLPLKIFCEYLKKTTNAKIALLLIEPERTDFGEKLTKKLQATAKKITEILSALLPK